MGLFGKKAARSHRSSEGRGVGLNMLPSDNVYVKAAMGANKVFEQRGWKVQVAAVRMLSPGELEVALVVPTNGPGTVRASLDALPGPTAVLEPVQDSLKMFGHSVDAQYFAESEWSDVVSSPAWRYQD